MNFKILHENENPLLIGNVWDVASAKTAEELNFKAIGTSSGAIATMLGYQDGEEISFAEVEYLVGRISKATTLPLTVDLEAGYSRHPDKIVDHIERLVQLGVVGINLEDSLVHQKREILPAEAFADTLTKVCSQLTQKKIKVFMNVRTDTFLLGGANPIQQTIERAKKYAKAGADGLFVPGIEKEEDMEALIPKIDLALNVMCLPHLPPFETLKKLGVKRISMGNFVYNKMNKFLKMELEAIQMNESFQTVFHSPGEAS